MVKADLAQDYYGDLGLTFGAGEADIKKAFKKLALKYHPDRNPGREAEVNSQFQTINTAHEVLTDPEQRAKYDLGRRAGGGRPAATPANRNPPGGFAKGNPWASAGSQWAPPPKRETRPRPPPASSGAQRYTSNFKTPNTSSNTKPNDTDTNRERWEAWNNMKGPGAQKPQPFNPPPPKAVPKEYTPQSGREESNSFKHPPPPRSNRPGYEEFRAGAASFGRPQNIPQRPPPPPARKAGFTPHNLGGDEPPAPKTSAYFTRRDSRQSATNSPIASSPPPLPTHKPEPKVFKDARFVDDDMGTPFEPRVSTPYATHGGEKLNPFDNINLTRARSTRERTPRQFSPDSDRRRSLSPQRTRVHRNISPDNVPRAGSDANLKSRLNTSPKRTFSTANRNGNSQKPRPTYPTVESESSSSEEEELRPARPMAKVRTRRTHDLHQSELNNVESLHSSNRNGSTSSGGGVKGPSPTYATPSRTSSFKPSVLPVVHEESVFVSGFADKVSALNICESSSKVYLFTANPMKTFAVASSGGFGSSPNVVRTNTMQTSQEDSSVVSGKLQNPFSASASSISEDFVVGVSATPTGSLNAFEARQFKLLDRLLTNNESPTGSHSLYGSRSELEMGPESSMACPRMQTYGSESFRSAQRLIQLAKNTATELGSPKKKSRFSETVLASKSLNERYNLVSDKSPQTDNYRSSFSFKTGSESERQHPYQFTSNSEENISTDFTSAEWKAKFEAGDNYFAADPSRSRAMSGNPSGRRSPVRKRPVNRSTVGGGTSIPPIDPEILGQPRDDDGFAGSPGGTKFKPEEWNFKPETFVYPPNGAPGPPNRKAPLRRPSKMGSASSKGPSTTKTVGTAAMVNEDSSSDDPLYMKTVPSDEPSGVDSPNAMDIDSPAEQRPTQPRNVPVEPSNPAWREQANGTIPDPPLPPRSPNANISKPRTKQDGDELKVKLDDLKNVEPLKQPATGLNSFNDMASSLPWTSKPATVVPLSHSVSTGKLDLPHPPKAPLPPAITAESMRPTTSAWSTYMDHFRAYMASWRDFDIKMVHHFVARREQIDAMSFGNDWLGEFGDAKLEKYETWLGEDKVVMAWWEEASRRHAAAMQEFHGWKGAMKDVPAASRFV